VLEALVGGVLLGLASAPHCVAMCGPLTAFAAVDGQRVAQPGRALRYQAGRVIGYGAVGAVAGSLGRGVTSFVPVEAEAVFSFVLALTLAFAALRAWPRTPRGSSLVSLSRGPRPPSWSARLGGALGALFARVPRRPVVLGIASALLPCGVLASGALLAAGSGGALAGSAAMLGLALGSGLALTVGSLVLGRVDLSAHRHAAMALSAVLAIGAVLLVFRPLMATGASCHAG
jgi:sulfite exporter TauE/SafE